MTGGGKRMGKSTRAWRTLREALRRAALAALAMACLWQAGGCATSEPVLSEYVRDGRQYGVTEGRFRGRWWNYYERGRSFGSGGFWEEAEQDFRVAITQRGTDARWVRTYGLRFLPDYFPNREIGIALYHQGELDEAVERLETSLSQTHSARAAYHLGLALRDKLLEADADLEPPAFELIEPSLQRPAARFEVTLRGIARDDQYVGRVWVDGAPVPIDRPAAEVEVRHTAALTPQDNTVTVTVEDLTGKRWEQVLDVPFDLDGPSVSFDEPVEIPGLVRGVAHHPSGVTAMFAGGVQAQLRPLNGGETVAFEARVAQTPEASVSFVCMNALGNVTRGVLPIAGAAPEPLAERTQPDRPMIAHAGLGLAGLGLSPQGSRPPGAAAPMQLANVTGQAPGGTLYVRLLNISDGAVFQQEDIVVTIEVASAAPLAEITVNGWPVQFVPDRERQTVSRRVLLPPPAPGSGGEAAAFELVVRARDLAENLAEAAVSVYREDVSGAFSHERLRLALMGVGLGPFTQDLPGVAELVRGRLDGHIWRDGRFVLLGRDLRVMEQVSREAEIRALAPETYRNTPELQPAEALVWGKIGVDSQSIELHLDAVATEMYAGSGDYALTLARVDVCGPFDPAGSEDQQLRQLDELTEMLYLRFRQEFPLVRGPLWAVPRHDRFAAFLDAPRVREGVKVVLYRSEHVEVLGRTRHMQVQLAEGLIQNLRGELAEGTVVALEEAHAPVFETLVGREQLIDEDIWVSTK